MTTEPNMSDASLSNEEIHTAIQQALGHHNDDTHVEVSDINGHAIAGYAYVLVSCPRLRSKSSGGWFSRDRAVLNKNAQEWREHMDTCSTAGGQPHD